MGTQELIDAIEQWWKEDAESRGMMIFLGEFNDHDNATKGPIVMSARVSALLRQKKVAEILKVCSETAEKLSKTTQQQ